MAGFSVKLPAYHVTLGDLDRLLRFFLEPTSLRDVWKHDCAAIQKRNSGVASRNDTSLAVVNKPITARGFLCFRPKRNTFPETVRLWPASNHIQNVPPSVTGFTTAPRRGAATQGASRGPTEASTQERRRPNSSMPAMPCWIISRAIIQRDKDSSTEGDPANADVNFL